MNSRRRVSDNGHEILIVEDSPTQAVQLERLLKQRGYIVRTASNAEEALAAIREQRPSIIVSDIQMPGMDGYELCRTIKSQQELRDLPVVLLTALASPHDVLKGLQCGADNFICKPYDEKYLCSRLSHILTNIELRKKDKMHFGVELELAGERHFLTAERHQILDLLISTAQEAARANDSLRERQRELIESQQALDALYRLAAGLNKSNTEREVIESVLKHLRQLPCVQAMWVHLLNEDGRFHIAGSRGLPPALEAPGALEGDCGCRQKLIAGELDEASNIYECERLSKAQGDTQGLRYHASVALQGATGPLGLLNLVAQDRGMFNKEELGILKGAGHQIGAALERARLQEGLERLVEQRTAALQAEVSERKQAEESFREVVEFTPDALVGVSADGRISIVNTQTEKLFGYQRKELLGRPVEILLPERFRETHKGHRAAYSSNPQPGVMGANLELYGLRKDGAEFPIEVSLSMLQMGKEDVVLSAIRDVSERKKLEQQLRISQRMEAVGLLAGGVAHDFNNLLSVILGQCDLLLEELDLKTGSRRRIAEVKRAGERATSLTRQLLAFGRKQVLQPQILNLNSILADMDKMLRRLIGEDIELTTLLDPALGNVKADPGQIEQIVMNLVVNARDAMPRGGKLTIETSNKGLDEAYALAHVSSQPGPHVLLAVSDTGHGMDEETRAHIFEPFFTTKEKDKGTGLGLATVYGIVKQSGGNIWVYSEPGQGTTFKVYLPQVKEAVTVAESSSAPQEVQRGWETVLLVEDDEPLRMLAHEFLESGGYTVLEAGNGTEALEIGEKHKGPIHLLLTDVVMPKMSGAELAKRLESRRPEMKVLFMSGYTNNAISHHGVLDPGKAFIEKPFRKEMLQRRLREVLQLGRGTRNNRKTKKSSGTGKGA